MKKLYNILTIAASAIILALAVSCSAMEKSDAGPDSNSGENGKGGSMARFTIVGDHMYTVDNSTLKVINIEDPAQPNYLYTRDQYMDFDVETIYPCDGKLFIGSRSAMYIYDVERPEFPVRLSRTSHITSCDPVVAAGDYAYVTINTASNVCFRGSNELIVFDISDPRDPKRVGGDRTMYSPKGLGIDELYAKLFVCDGMGVKIFDVTDPTTPVWIDDLGKVLDKRIDAYDVIPMDGLLIVIGSDGLYQFDYTEEEIAFVSKISVPKQ